MYVMLFANFKALSITVVISASANKASDKVCLWNALRGITFLIEL